MSEKTDKRRGDIDSVEGWKVSLVKNVVLVMSYLGILSQNNSTGCLKLQKYTFSQLQGLGSPSFWLSSWLPRYLSSCSVFARQGGKMRSLVSS